MEFRVTAENIPLAMQAIGAIRGSGDPVSSVVADIRSVLGGDCCRTGSREFVGHMAVAQGSRFKKMQTCTCCRNLHIDDDGHQVTGSIQDYLTKLVKKHGEVTLFISNEHATVPSPPPGLQHAARL